jgi:guanosine-3',5'-bis(diphosphate) 3'-pyrophosphohydrolase
MGRRHPRRPSGKICSLRDILASPPAGWSLARQQKYFDGAKEVVDQARGVDPKLEWMFDRLFRQRLVS